MNYYIAQVATGHEKAFLENINKLHPQLAQQYNFTFLTRELYIQRTGEKSKELQPVFPSYVIVETSSEIAPETTWRLSGTLWGWVQKSTLLLSDLSKISELWLSKVP